jgi:hypothetical protein
MVSGTTKDKKMMERIEKRYPHAVNCIGTVDIQSQAMEEEKCGRCRFIVACYRRGKELEGAEFKPGKWRPGFGKPKGYVYERA